MEKYMELSHQIMADIYNLSTYNKDYNFSILTQNREKLAELLEFADDTRNTLIIKRDKCNFDFILLKGKSNYVANHNILFDLRVDQSIIKSKNVMNKLSDVLDQLESRIGSNDLFELESQRGFAKRIQLDSEHGDETVYDEKKYFEEYGDDLEVDEIIGQ